VRSRFIVTTRPPLVAGAAANRLQDCCSRISVSARTCSGVPVCRSTEHQGPAIETATTVMVVGHVSRPYVAPVHCRRPRFPDCRCTSLEYSVAGRSFIQLCQLSSVGSRPNSSHEVSLTDATAWIFVLFVRQPRSFSLCHPNQIRSIIIIINIWQKHMTIDISLLLNILCRHCIRHCVMVHMWNVGLKSQFLWILCANFAPYCGYMCWNYFCGNIYLLCLFNLATMCS